MAKLIVDTSVWIDFFKGQLPAEIYNFLTEEIRQLSVGLTDVIQFEILVGAKTPADYQKLKSLLSAYDCYKIGEKESGEFEKFGWRLWRMGLGGKYTDASIAFICHQNNFPLLTFDGYFRKLEKKGILKTLATQ